MSANAVTTTQDPLVRAYGSLARWHRGRQLVLAAFFGAAVIGAAMRGLEVEGSTPPQELVLSLERPAGELEHHPVSAGRVWAEIPSRGPRGLAHPGPPWGPLELQIQNHDGTWFLYNLMRVDQLELRVDADLVSVEPAVRVWAGQICAPVVGPQRLHLVGFSDLDTLDGLSQLLVDACPSLRVYAYAPKPSGSSMPI
jgi:hypothetical protein